MEAAFRKDWSMKLKNVFGHLKTITKHKWIVFKLSIKAGIPIRGFLHDLSKYSPTEFIESVRYYQGGERSPIKKAKEVKGYSDAYLHHIGRNKHHSEYWYDFETKETPIIPFKYSAEMICDKLAAGMVYQKEKWNEEYELKYWEEKEKGKTPINQKIEQFITEVFIEVSKNGIDKTIKKENLKRIYDKHCSILKKD